MAKLPDIPDYKIETTLGRGGMASVYRARHLRLDRPVALKVMHLNLADSDPQFSERFLREARIAANLSHPYLVQIYDVNKHDDYHYIAMEYVNGGDLEMRLNEPMDPNELLRIIEQVATGLDYAHNKGYVHRDIKPANILFRDNGEALVSDFGIAKALDSNTQLTQMGSVIGTPAYMSPEQAEAKTVDGRSDLYSLAVMVYQILVGKLPYSADSSLSLAIMHINNPVPTLPEPLAAVQPFIDKGMAKKPDDRFSTGAELVAGLRECLAELHPGDLIATQTIVLQNLEETAKQKTPTKKTTTVTIQLPQMPVLGAGLLALVAIAALIWFLLPTGPSQVDKARIDLLLSEAQQDIRARRFTDPENNNALQKYRDALSIAPDYDPVLEAIQYLGGILLTESEKALSAKDWTTASNLAEQVLMIAPDNSAAAQQLQKIAQARQALLDQQQASLSAASALLNQQRWQGALESYRQLPKNLLQQESVQSEIADQLRIALKTAQQQTSDGEFDEAEQLLTDTIALTDLLSDQTLASQFKQALNDNRNQKNRYYRDQRLAQALSNAQNAKTPKQAAQHYQQALLISPNNQQAKAGLRNNSTALLSNIKTAVNTGQLDQAREQVKAAEVLRREGMFSNAQLVELEQLQRGLTLSSAEQRELDVLFDRFRRYMAAPKVTSAHKIYRRITAITSIDPRLPALRQQLGDGYLDLAKKEEAAKDWDDVITWAERGLEAAPDHAGLKQIKAKAEAVPPGERKRFIFF